MDGTNVANVTWPQLGILFTIAAVVFGWLGYWINRAATIKFEQIVQRLETEEDARKERTAAFDASKDKIWVVVNQMKDKIHDIELSFVKRFMTTDQFEKAMKLHVDPLKVQLASVLTKLNKLN